MNFAKFHRTPFFKEHLRWLLLAVVTMFWYLEHWSTLYLKLFHKLRWYICALRIVCQPTVSNICSYSKLVQFTGMKQLKITVVTWDDRDNTLRSKNFRKTFWYLQFLCKSCINIWCLRRNSPERNNTYNSPTFTLVNHTTRSVWKHCWLHFWQIR